MTSPSASSNLSRGQKALLLALGVIVPLFGALVVWRSCFMSRRHTDFGVYARAGWAVRSGHDIYEVTDTGGLHYCYPSSFAVLMTPFAEPPTMDGSRRFLPFSLSVTIWYLLGVGFAFAAAHMIASAVESKSATPISARRWWELRFWPVLITLPALGNNLSHGQVNSLLLLLVACMLAAMIRGHSRIAGAWLAGAITLKVIPAFLLLLPVVRRDRRFVGGLVLGLIVMLVGLPAAVFGSANMWQYHKKFIDVMIHPAMAGADQAERAVEMFHVLQTDNQSIQAVLHAWQHWGDANAPAESSNATRAIHWFLGIAMTATTCFAARGRMSYTTTVNRRNRFHSSSSDLRVFVSSWFSGKPRRHEDTKETRRRTENRSIALHQIDHVSGNDLLLLGGALTVVMLFVSPMCHLHYYVLTLPLVTGLIYAAWQIEGQQSIARFKMAFTIHLIGNVIPLVFESFRNLGFAPLSTLSLWALAVSELRRPRVAMVVRPVELRKAA